ncbi:DNA replication/repair protein RecF [Halobacteriovorax marinus]|uniref:DNA replication/repair protein RecF n=1 Tax=Halobacteriovorax marinus TaxID=97084 RepID=UPI003A929477
MHSFKISKLQVTNFRNLQPDIIEFNSGINCILGENGNGKTNILEALHVLSTRKSFRKNTAFPQFLGIDCEQPEIIFSSVFLDEHSNKMSLSAKMDAKTTHWFVDGQPMKRKLDLKLVFINPFDSYAFHNTSSFRRQWMDQHISQIDSNYKKCLSRYNSSLRFRNSLLSKKPAKYLEQIRAIDLELARYSCILTNTRLKFLSEIESFCTQTFKEIFSEEHLLKITLDSRVIGASEDDIYQMLQERLPKDEIVGHTTYCVHKDDYVLLFDGLNSFEYCSLGQQKMSYLSLLFAYIELFRYNFNSFPMVLIDDVSGELDKNRWQKLINYLERSSFQVLITTANEKFKEELETIHGANKIYVQAGSITNMPNSR